MSAVELANNSRINIKTINFEFNKGKVFDYFDLNSLNLIYDLIQNAKESDLNNFTKIPAYINILLPKSNSYFDKQLHEYSKNNLYTLVRRNVNSIGKYENNAQFMDDMFSSLVWFKLGFPDDTSTVNIYSSPYKKAFFSILKLPNKEPQEKLHDFFKLKVLYPNDISEKKVLNEVNFKKVTEVIEDNNKYPYLQNIVYQDLAILKLLLSFEVNNSNKFSTLLDTRINDFKNLKSPGKDNLFILSDYIKNAAWLKILLSQKSFINNMGQIEVIENNNFRVKNFPYIPLERSFT